MRIYGYILPDEGGDKVFAHSNDLYRGVWNIISGKSPAAAPAARRRRRSGTVTTPQLRRGAATRKNGKKTV